MANSIEMLRLMRHAANLLDGCDPADVADIALRAGAGVDDRRFVLDTAVRQAAAIATASAILRMVAAAMDDEPPAGAPEVTDGR